MRKRTKDLIADIATAIAFGVMLGWFLAQGI